MQIRGPGSSRIIFKFLRRRRHPPSSSPTNSIIIMHLHNKLQNKLIFAYHYTYQFIHLKKAVPILFYLGTYFILSY